MAARRAQNSGFTLMEVMIAVAIVSLMGGLIYASFGPLLRAKEVIEEESEHYRALNVALSRMTREISMAFISNDFDHARYRDKNDMPTFFMGERDRLMFTSFAHQRRYKDAKESDQAIFEYKIAADPEAEGTGSHDVLMRREKVVLDEEYERGGSEQVLSDDVKKVKFEYYDDEKKEWVNEWSTRRDRQNLPERVRVTVTTTDSDGKDVDFSTEARIFLRLPIAH